MGLQERSSKRTYQLRIPLEGRARITPGLDRLVQTCLWITILGLITVSGCATAPDDGVLMGLRDGVATQRITRIAVVHVGIASGWESDAEGLGQTYLAQVETSLTSLGIATMSRSEVDTALRGTELSGRLGEALDIDRPLAEIFEKISPDGLDERTQTVLALRELLGVDAVLVAQVVYHTEAMCDGSTQSVYTPYIVTPDGPPADARVPCAISHFEAKLLDTRTGRTIWYNRALREVRARTADSPVPNSIANADATVDLVLQQGPTSLRILVQR